MQSPIIIIKISYMPAPDEYRRYAKLCDELATTVDDKAERAAIRERETRLAERLARERDQG